MRTAWSVIWLGAHGVLRGSHRNCRGIDIIPEHNSLSDLTQHLDREQQKAEDFGDAYNVHAQLRRVLGEAGVPDKYDILICDPPATEGSHLYNAIYATRNLLLPIEPSAKGQAAVEGLEELATNFADQLNIDVGVLGAVPIGFKGTRDQEEMLETIPYEVPGSSETGPHSWRVAGDSSVLRSSTFQAHRDRRRDYEVETLAQFDRIARFIETQGGIEAPNPRTRNTR